MLNFMIMSLQQLARLFYFILAVLFYLYGGLKWQNPNIQLVCAESAVKFNIWDVVGVVLSLIITSSDEIDSLRSDLRRCSPIL